MVGDENGDSVTWFGLDITAPFEFMACHIASVVYWLVALFRDHPFCRRHGHHDHMGLHGFKAELYLALPHPYCQRHYSYFRQGVMVEEIMVYSPRMGMLLRL